MVAREEPSSNIGNISPASGQVKKQHNVIKSANDDRLYRHITLENQLEILLISDESAEKSAAAVDVHVGFLLDPDAVPGIAHFCEHMLFLGTEKYPIENGFTEFLSQNGGMSNASTNDEHTNYYFDVKSEVLTEGLDRFAQFFLNPLFNADATERELNAIESEHQKNKLNDSRRIGNINKITSKENHPYRHFGSGNMVTLKEIPKEKNIDIRELLLNFHQKFYSANIMKVAVIGRESLDKLEEIVVPLFEKVNNKNVVVPRYDESPLGEQELGIVLNVLTIKEMKKLKLIFPIPDVHDEYKEKPTHYISHLIGHEGKGSLLSYLKKKAWVKALSAGPVIGANGFSFFFVELQLNENGMKHVDDIILAFFQYIELLKKEGPKEWVYREDKMLTELEFRFKDKERPTGYVSYLARNMQKYPSEDVIYGRYRLDKFAPEQIKNVLNLISPRNFRYILASQSLKDKVNKISPHYEAEYGVEHIPEETLERWCNAMVHPDLTLPTPNLFIPDDLELKVPQEEKEEKGIPTLIKDTEMVRVWFKEDDTFFLPKSCLKLLIISPYGNSSPCNLTQLSIFLFLLKDELNEYAYDAELAGINYNVYATNHGIFINISGYNDKQLVLLEKILEKLVRLEIKEDRFNVAMELTEETLRNTEVQQPYIQLGEHWHYLLEEGDWSSMEQLETLPDISLESLKSFSKEVLKNLYVETLICGNVSSEQVGSIIKVVENILIEESKARRLFPIQHMKHREYQLPNGCSYLFEKRNKVHDMSCVQIYLQIGLQDTRLNALSELFASMLKEPCFDTLRTKEQLGYIVGSGLGRSASVQGIKIIVQSDRSPGLVEERIDLFLESFEEYLTSMSEEKFQSFVDGLAVRKLEKPKRLQQEVARYTTEIISKQYNFRRAKIEVEKLKEIKKEEIITFYNKYVSPKSKERKKLAIVILGKDSKSLLETDTSEKKIWNVIDNALQFKSTMPLYPLLLPYNDVPLLPASAKSKL